MYKKLTSLFFIFSLILPFSVFAVDECILDGSAASQACMGEMMNDVNNANFAALLGIGAMGFGVYHLITRDKDEEEKKELLANFRSGNGLELYKKNDFGVYFYKQKKLENFSTNSHEEYFKKFREPTNQILSIEYKLH